MTLGTFGSTLNDELNRLANGGTYRTMATMVDEALAAKQWANRENIIPYSTDTVGILNEIAGLGTDKRNWLDFNGVCNYIAGTTGLPAAAALRQVYNTTDLLTSQSAFYVDSYAGSNYIPTTASGYMYLPGVTSNYASAPDSTALDITGDIDIRCKVALDNWRPASFTPLIAKLGASGNRSYRLAINTDGTVNVYCTSDGNTAIEANSTVSTGLLDGSVKWIRGVIDINNGASGKDFIFYTSDDGTNWTQLGTTVTQAGTIASIYNSSTALEIGSQVSGTAPARGKFYRAQVLNGIGGTTAFDANFETAMTSQTVASFTESSSNAATVTINRNTYNFQLDTIANLGAAGSLLPTTLGSSTAADSNDPKFLDFTGTNYVYLPGVASNYLSVPDSAALDVTGDIDLRVQIAMDDWTPGTTTNFIAKEQSGTTRSYRLGISTGGQLFFNWSADGTTALSSSATIFPLSVADGTSLWIRATLDVDNGAAGNTTTFYTSTNGTTWTQLGDPIVKAGITSIFSSTSILEIGSRFAGSLEPLAGKIYRAQIFNGIDGTKVLDVDTSVITAGSATSFTAVTGQTVTINRSTSGRKTVAVTQPTWLFGTDDYMEVNNRWLERTTANYLYLPGVASNYASAPDSAALDITGDIDLRVKVALDDWTPSAISALISKDTSAGNNRSFQLNIQTNGTLRLLWTTDGVTALTADSTVATGVTDGTTKWIRATLDVNNGASGRDIQFFTSDDGTTWTQLGSTVTQAGTTSIYAGTGVLEVGSNNLGGNNPARGKFFRAQVYNGIGGTLAFDANFEGSITSLNQASFTESSSNAATVTINRSGSTYRSAGITTAGYLYPGATNTFSNSTIDYLTPDANTNMTVLMFRRKWNTSPSYRGAFSGRGYNVQNYDTGNIIYANLGQVSGNVQSFSTTWTPGSLQYLGLTIDRSTGKLTTLATNGNAPQGTISGNIAFLTTTLRIAESDDIELVAFALFRSVLTTAQIRQISNYFANREVYL